MLKRDERIERLISRKLDGELTEDEQLELDRALIRSPEHRALQEEILHIDSVCGASVRVACATDGGDAGYSTLAMPREMVRPRPGRAWWLLPGALAACLGWLVIGGVFNRPHGDRENLVVHPVAPIEAGRPFDLRRAENVVPVDADNIRRVGTGQGSTKGRRDTGVYGLIGDDGNVYVIEVDRLRAVRRLSAPTRVRVPLGDL